MFHSYFIFAFHCNLSHSHAKPPISSLSLTLFGWCLKRKKKKKKNNYNTNHTNNNNTNKNNTKNNNNNNNNNNNTNHTNNNTNKNNTKNNNNNNNNTDNNSNNNNNNNNNKNNNNNNNNNNNRKLKPRRSNHSSDKIYLRRSDKNKLVHTRRSQSRPRLSKPSHNLNLHRSLSYSIPISKYLGFAPDVLLDLLFSSLLFYNNPQ